MIEMIKLYLKQTPPLLSEMKQSLSDNDWYRLYTTVHKLIPSLSIIGMPAEFETLAKNVQEYASAQQHLEELPEMANQLMNACSQTCDELEEKFDLKKPKE